VKKFIIEIEVTTDDLRRIATFLGLKNQIADVYALQRFAEEEVANAIRELARK